MGAIRCNRCGQPLEEGSTKYQVDLRIRSMFDGVLQESGVGDPSGDIDDILAELSECSEEELNRQVYQDDVFIMCPSCKEAFIKDIYSHINPKASPDANRAPLIH